MVSAAARDVCGLVLVAGAGRRWGNVLRAQLAANPDNAPILAAARSAIAGRTPRGRHECGSGPVQPDRVNHVLKRAPAEREANLATYGDPALPLASGVARAIARFVRAPAS